MTVSIATYLQYAEALVEDLAKEADIRTALRNLTQTFIAITEARATYVPKPGIKWANEVIIVNRKRAQIFWPPKNT